MFQIPNVYLIGPMGAGKTTVGRQLADIMGRRFLDSDQEIEVRTGASVSWIFEKEGERGFRIREEQAINELAQETGVILATGGGAILSTENRRVLQKSGLVVYLNTPVSMQLQRLAKDRSRPLLQNGNIEQILTNLYTMRHPLYLQTAHIVIPTWEGTAKELAFKVKEHIVQYHMQT